MHIFYYSTERYKYLCLSFVHFPVALFLAHVLVCDRDGTSQLCNVHFPTPLVPRVVALIASGKRRLLRPCEDIAPFAPLLYLPLVNSLMPNSGNYLYVFLGDKKNVKNHFRRKCLPKDCL